MESASQAGPGARFGYADDAVAMGAIGNTCVVHWRGQKTADRAQRERLWLDRVAKDHPGRTLAMFVIGEHAPPLDEDMRRAAADMIRARTRDLLGVAVVVEATGFRGAMVRALLTTIETVLGSHAFPSKYYADVPSATRWLVQTGASANPRQLWDMSEALRHADGSAVLRAAGS